MTKKHSEEGFEMVGKMRLWMPGSDGESEFYNIHDGEHKYYAPKEYFAPAYPAHLGLSICLLLFAFLFLMAVAWYWMRDTGAFRATPISGNRSR